MVVVTGISMLLADALGWPLAVFIILVNFPFLIWGWKQLGGQFAWKTALAIGLLAIWIAVIPFPIAPKDKLLAAVFGGVFIGAGVGLAIRAGGVLDGTEVLAVLLSKRTAATVGEIILLINIIIFITAAWLRGAEPAMYSVLTYFTAYKTIDFILHGLEAYNGVTIFSSQHIEIKSQILNQLGRGVTVLKAIGGYSSQEQEVLYCVVTRLELNKLETLVKALDEQAFIVVTPILEVTGGVVKQRQYM